VADGDRLPGFIALELGECEPAGHLHGVPVRPRAGNGTDAASNRALAELRDNLIARLRSGAALFPGIIGYEESVVPQIENAVLSGQDIVFLGERGQAKTRMARLLTELLDPEMPALAGCEINDNPFAPICQACRERVAERGDKAEIAWIPRDRRYGEKLATPDITIADLIGEVDPIKVAEGRYLGDELTIHYGLVPRTNRGIFALNELPDLSYFGLTINVANGEKAKSGPSASIASQPLRFRSGSSKI
jgi:magnesium chelatase subunit I